MTMDIAEIKGAKRRLQPPKNWDHARQGLCLPLPILDREDATGAHWMISAWRPSPADLEALNAGACIQVAIGGSIHPPISVGVTEPPEKEPSE